MPRPDESPRKLVWLVEELFKFFRIGCDMLCLPAARVRAALLRELVIHQPPTEEEAAHLIETICQHTQGKLHIVWYHRPALEILRRDLRFYGGLN